MQQQMILDTYDTDPKKPLPGETMFAYEKRMAKAKLRPPLPKRNGNVVELKSFQQNQVTGPKMSDRERRYLDHMSPHRFMSSSDIITAAGVKRGSGGHSHSLNKLCDLGLAKRKRDKTHANRYFYKRISTDN